MKILPILFIALSVFNVKAANYYVSSSSGNDANPGTKAQPWAKAPGMLGFAGTYVHSAGDHIYLKGGDVWTAQANCLWRIRTSGTAINPDYWGVDQTWFVGGSFTRPAIDCQNANFMGATDGDPNAFAVCLTLTDGAGSHSDYLTIDGIEWKNLYRNNTSANEGHYEYIWISTASHDVTITNNYFHSWSHGPNTTIAGIGIMVGDPSNGANIVAVNNLIDGLTTANSTDFQSSGSAFYLWKGDIIGNTIRNCCNGARTSAGFTTFAYNSVGPIWNSYYVSGNPAEHDNGIRIPQGGGAGNIVYVHDNYIHDTSSAMMFWGDSGETVYFYNNVVYNPRQSPVFSLDPLSVSGGKTFAYNNTIYAASQDLFYVPGRGGAHSYAVASSVNNHLIGVGALTNFSSTPLNAFTNLTTVIQSSATATAQGYVLGNLYAPTSSSGDTFNAGQDVSSSIPGTSLDILGVARPQSPARWDAGAYEFTGGIGMPPNQPSNVTPASSATGVSLNPTLAASAYSDPQGSAQTDSEWQVYTAGGTILIWDSGNAGAVTSFAVGVTLLPSTTYTWTVRYRNALSLWSSWSVQTPFTTILKPNTPSNVAPANGATGISVSPTLQASIYSDGNPSAQLASQWKVFAADGVTLVYDSGTQGAVIQFTIPNSTIAYSTTYKWQVRYENVLNVWSDYSAQTSFATGSPFPPSTPANANPLDGSLNISLTPTLFGTPYSDPNVVPIAQKASEWKITLNSVPVMDATAGAVTSFTVPPSTLLGGTLYQWSIRYQNLSNVWSSFSAPTQFTTASPNAVTVLKIIYGQTGP